MTFMLIFSAAVIASLLLSGHAKTMKANDWLAVAIALIGVNFMRGGNWIAGPALIAGAAVWRGSFFFLTPLPKEKNANQNAIHPPPHDP